MVNYKNDSANNTSVIAKQYFRDASDKVNKNT